MLIVQKYGGTSVGSIERIKGVAQRVSATHDAGHQVAVVVSAMSGETNRLLGLAKQISPHPDERECDVLVSTGEQVTVALLAMVLKDMGYPAFSLLGHQVQISTDSAFGRARIKHISAERLLSGLHAGNIAVVAGFQGVDEDDNITTLGRGGSDTTAVAIAAATQADACEIYTDVDGVYSADPRICPNAHKLNRISYDEMLELASLGAKVLQIRSVEFAKRYQVPVHVRSSFSMDEGTWLVHEDAGMEDVTVAGVTSDLDQTKITILHVPDRPGLAARVFGPIAESNIVVDMIIQNTGAEGFTDLTFTVPRGDAAKALALVNATVGDVGAGGVTSDANVAKVSIVGLGMRSHAGVASRMFQTLAREGINVQMISTSEIKISIVVDARYSEPAVRALHDAFFPPVTSKK
jgi:aspartate kinase